MTFELPVIFHSQGVPLVGRFIRNTESCQERQPAIIVTGSWLTVKEQMARTYGLRLAEKGYTAFIFDFSGFGESHGDPRQAEIPARKILDIRAATGFLQSVGFVDSDRIGCLSICASAQYTLSALAENVPIRSFASVAGWYHDPKSIAPFYGGDAGVALRLGRAHDAVERFVRHREVALSPAYKEADDRAGMSFRLDYYGRTDRGAIPEWKNEMADMTWLYWLTYDGLSAAEHVATPSLFVHSDGAAFPDHVKQVHSRVKGPKRLVWGNGTQNDFYDQPDAISTAITAATDWFEDTLRK